MTMPTPDIYTKGYPSLSVGLCQVYTERWDVEGNFERTMAALEEASEQGAELAITPENVFQGYPPQGTKEDQERHKSIADTLDGPRLAEVRKLARACQMDIVVGFTEKNGDRFHNSCAYIHDDGSIGAVYRKVHCRPFESIEHDGIFTPGTEFPVVEFRRGNRFFHIGLMICFDREIPESVRCLRAGGAQFIACPLATDTFDMKVPPRRADNELLTRARAAENELFIAVVNHSGIYNGGTFIVGPSGELIARLESNAMVQTIEVPIGGVEEQFHSDPWGWAGWGYRRPDVYRPYLDAAIHKKG